MFSVFGHHVFASLKRGIFRSFLCAHIFTSLCRSGETGVVGYVPMYPKIDFLQNFCAVLYMEYVVARRSMCIAYIARAFVCVQELPMAKQFPFEMANSCTICEWERARWVAPIFMASLATYFHVAVDYRVHWNGSMDRRLQACSLIKYSDRNSSLTICSSIQSHLKLFFSLYFSFIHGFKKWLLIKASNRKFIGIMR